MKSQWANGSEELALEHAPFAIPEDSAQYVNVLHVLTLAPGRASRRTRSTSRSRCDNVGYVKRRELTSRESQTGCVLAPQIGTARNIHAGVLCKLDTDRLAVQKNIG